MNMKKLGLFAVGFLALVMPITAQAQNPYAAARFVNDSIISNYEVDQRARLLRALGIRAPDAKSQALQMLTEDAVKLGQAKALGLSVPDDALGEATAQYAEQRQMSVGGLQSRLRSAGVDQGSFDKFLGTSVMWREIVQARFRTRATPSDSDLENVMNIAAGAASESVFIREIAIPFAERGIEGARNLAARIRRDVANGANFSDIARAVSRTPSAQNGGAIGWTPVSRLPAQIASRVLTLSPGQVSSPLEVPAGVILFQLVDIREDSNATRNDVLTTFVRLDVPVADSQDDAIARANSLRAETQTCDEASALPAEGFGPDSGEYGPVNPNALPQGIALALMQLDAGETGLAIDRGDVVSVIYLCNRSVNMNPDQIEDLRLQLFNQRLTRFGDDYLQELLSDAIIKDG